MSKKETISFIYNLLLPIVIIMDIVYFLFVESFYNFMVFIIIAMVYLRTLELYDKRKEVELIVTTGNTVQHFKAELTYIEENKK